MRPKKRQKDEQELFFIMSADDYSSTISIMALTQQYQVGRYDPLRDPYLATYFQRPAVRRYLQRIGVVSCWTSVIRKECYE